MKTLIIAIVALGVAGPVAAQDFEKCSITPVDQVGFVDTFTDPESCVEACKTTDGCDSWSFLPHSFDSSMPGQCKLIKGVFKKEESERGYCGEL